MEAAILAARAEQDSVGGVLECRIDGLPAGLGAPFFDSVESVLSQLMFSIPAVKGIAFGAGFGFASLRGSQANDPFRMEAGRVVTQGNNCGGILGGITTGGSVIFRVVGAGHALHRPGTADRLPPAGGKRGAFHSRPS